MIRLRAIEESDLPQLRDWRNDDRLRFTFREYRLLNLVNQQDWLEYTFRSREVEMFGIEADGTLAGVCGLCYINWICRTAETSIYVAPDLKHPGVAESALELLKHKAFEEFDLRRLWSEVYEFDTVKVALLEQCGFVLEGRLREHVFQQGSYHDSLMYGLLRRV
jgi:RimJ/RimL family protein N-acetyltransferase